MMTYLYLCHQNQAYPQHLSENDQLLHQNAVRFFRQKMTLILHEQTSIWFRNRDNFELTAITLFRNLTE